MTLDESAATALMGTVALLLAFVILAKAKQRLALSFAKYPSLGGHLRMAKRMAHWIPAYVYTGDQWFAADGAAATVVQQRKQALDALGHALQSRSPLTLAHNDATKPMISDMQFISHYRVPFQFKQVLQKQLRLASFISRSEGVWVTDMDGVRYIDVTGSYGVNLWGVDFYKTCMAEGALLGEQLGPVLGMYHPCVLDNVQRLCAISGKDEVSFHMSGTEAVMQAVRLARYHTGRKKIVRFTGSYHGFWDDVQPGPGNPMPPSSHTLTLREMHANTMRLLHDRSDIACVLVNPLSAMHPNKSAPTDSTLVDGSRSMHYDRAAYTTWLQQLRDVCQVKGIALIMDEVFLGFRLAPGGAQAYFGVDADMVTYGKTLGGGLPVGVVCGKAKWMRRFGDERPGDICFARGTFNAHPYVMGAMNVFLRRIQTPEIQSIYARAEQLWKQRMAQLNGQLQSAGLPVRVDGMETVWTVLYDTPSRYNWMFQFYLRQQGIALSWVGTGRMIFNFSFTDADFDEFCLRFVQAGKEMAANGWWFVPEGQTNQTVRRQIFKEMLGLKWGRSISAH